MIHVGEEGIQTDQQETASAIGDRRISIYPSRLISALKMDNDFRRTSEPSHHTGGANLWAVFGSLRVLPVETFTLPRSVES
jgi:hypothetical protein